MLTTYSDLFVDTLTDEYSHSDELIVTELSFMLMQCLPLCLSNCLYVWVSVFQPGFRRVYQTLTLVLPVLTCACETWTLLAANIKRLEAFYMKFQRQIATIHWQDHVRNTDVSSVTGLVPVLDPIFCWHSSQVGTCNQTSRGHTCPPSLVVPHRSVTRSPSRPELEAMPRPPLEQMAWPTPQGQQYTSCWPLENSGDETSCVDTRGDAATVLDDYTLMMPTRPRTYIAPLLFGLGIQLDHNYRSKFLLKQLSRLGLTVISYDEVECYGQSVLESKWKWYWSMLSIRFDSVVGRQRGSL